jgi:hypothetical protein
MTLPAAQSRTRFHTRQFLYECYRREDGLWDIDAELSDVKDHPYTLHAGIVPANQPIHNMQIRLTVDEGLTIRDVVAITLHAPFPDCTRAGDPMQAMIGRSSDASAASRDARTCAIYSSMRRQRPSNRLSRTPTRNACSIGARHPPVARRPTSSASA